MPGAAAKIGTFGRLWLVGSEKTPKRIQWTRNSLVIPIIQSDIIRKKDKLAVEKKLFEVFPIHKVLKQRIYSGLLIQEFRSLGKNHVTKRCREHLKQTIPKEKKLNLIKDLKLAWMHPIFRDLAEEKIGVSVSLHCRQVQGLMPN